MCVIHLKRTKVDKMYECKHLVNGNVSENKLDPTKNYELIKVEEEERLTLERYPNLAASESL